MNRRDLDSGGDAGPDPGPDLHLQQALRHAPDRDAVPPRALDQAVLAAARAAVAAPRASPPGRARVHSALRQLFDWSGRPALAGALGSLLLAGVIGLMWRDGPPPEALPGRGDPPLPGSAAPASPAPAAVADPVPAPSPGAAPAAGLPTAVAPPRVPAAAPTPALAKESGRATAAAAAPSPPPSPSPQPSPAAAPVVSAVPEAAVDRAEVAAPAAAPAATRSAAVPDAGTLPSTPAARAAPAPALAPAPAAAPAVAKAMEPAGPEAPAGELRARQADVAAAAGSLRRDAEHARPATQRLAAPARAPSPAPAAAPPPTGTASSMAAAFDPLSPLLAGLGGSDEPRLRQLRELVQAAQAARQGPWRPGPRIPAGRGTPIVDGQGRELGRLLWEGRLLRWQGADGVAWEASSLPL